MQATCDKPEDKERKHLRPLFLKGYVNGKPMKKMFVNKGYVNGKPKAKMLVDRGAYVNIMPYATYGSLG